MAGMHARSQRLQSAVPVEIPSEITGQYEGDQLAEVRAMRKPDDRFERLEIKHDKLDAKVETLDQKVDRVEIAIATVGGKMDLLPQMFQNLHDEMKTKREEGHVILKQTLEIDGHEAKARIDTKKTAAESKWKIAVAIVTGVTSAGVLGAIIALAATRC